MTHLPVSHTINSDQTRLGNFDIINSVINNSSTMDEINRSKGYFESEWDHRSNSDKEKFQSSDSLNQSKIALNYPSTRQLTLTLNPPCEKSLNVNQYQQHNLRLQHPVHLKIQHQTSSVQGPHTREHFGHDATYMSAADREEDVFSNSGSDMVDVPSDPYDNINGEQRFCGGYGEWGHVVTHVDRSILPDLKQQAFPDEIKNGADVIYNKMKYRVRRGKIRNQMLFFCIYCAHLELNRDVNPIQLGAQFGLLPGEVQRCDSIFSPLQTGYRPPHTKTSPLRYLPDYCCRMGVSEDTTPEVMKLAAIILQKDSTLYQENPQTVAAGLLKYYTVTNGITTDDPQKITNVTGRSNVTIEGMFRRIATIDNK